MAARCGRRPATSPPDHYIERAKKQFLTTLWDDLEIWRYQVYVETPAFAKQDARPYGALRKWAEPVLRARAGGMSETLEARVARLEDLQAINQLFVDYGEHLDAGDFEAYAQLFAEDGEVRLGPMGRGDRSRRDQGADDRQRRRNGGRTFHIVSSPRVALDGDRATSTVMWSVAVTGDDGLARLSMVGHHLDELTRTCRRMVLPTTQGRR